MLAVGLYHILISTGPCFSCLTILSILSPWRKIWRIGALDRREEKLTIHVTEPWSSVPFLLSSVKVFFSASFRFFDLAFYCLFSFCRIDFFIVLYFSLFFDIVLFLFLCLMWFHLYHTPTYSGLKGLVVVVLFYQFCSGSVYAFRYICHSWNDECTGDPLLQVC
jgi:hypothetical protein